MQATRWRAMRNSLGSCTATTISPVDISKFNSYAGHKDISLYEAFDHLNELEVDKFKFLALKQVLKEILKNKKRLRTLDLIHNLLFELEFYKYEIALQNHRNIQLLNQFYEFAEEFDSLYPDNDIDDFTDYLSYASNFEIEERNKTNKLLSSRLFMESKACSTQS